MRTEKIDERYDSAQSHVSSYAVLPFLLKVIVAVSTVEFGLMRLLPLMLRANTGPVLEAALDTGLVSLVVATALWWTVIRPLKVMNQSLAAASRAKRESLERLQKVLEVETVGVMFWDLRTGCMVDANDTFLNLLGYSRSEVEAGELTWQKLTPPEYMDTSRARLEKFLTTGCVGPYEKEYFRKDGARKWLLFAGNSLGDNQCVEFCVDISDRKKAEQALRESEVKYRTLVEQIPQAIFQKDRQSVYVSCNEGYARDLGIRASDIAGKTDFDFYPSHLAEKYRADDRRVMETRETVQIEEAYVAHGESRTILTSKTPVVGQDGEVIGVLGVFTDVTERKRAEDRLRVLSSAVEQSPVSVIITDSAGRIEYANPKACESAGYEFEDLIGKNPRILKSGETSPQEYHRLWETIRTGEWRGVFHNRKKNGELFWEAATIAPVRDGMGEIRHYLAVKEDITARREVEAALRVSEERFRIAAENTSDVIYDWDLESGAAEIFGTAARLFGGSAEAYPRTYEDFLRLLHPDDRGRVAGEIGRCIESGEHFRSEYRVVLQNGEIRYWTDQGRAILDAGGKARRWIGANTDVTERRLTEAALAAEAVRRRILFEQSKDGVVIFDGSGRAREANLSFANMLGYSMEELLRQHVWDWDAQLNKDQLAEMMRQVRSTPATFETVCRRKDGALLDVEVSSSAADLDGELFFYAVCRDISGRKAAESALRESEERFRLIAETITGVFWATAADNAKLLYVSPGYERLWGRSCASLYENPLSWFEAIHPDDRDNVQTTFQAQELRLHFELEYRVIRPDGSVRWVWDRGFPIRTGSEPVGYVGVAVDITDRKELEMQLGATEERLRLTLRASGVSVWTWNIAADSIEVDEDGATLFGLTAGQFARTVEEFAELVHPEDRARVQAELTASVEQDIPYKAEFRVPWPNGEIHFLATRGKVYRDTASRPLRLTGVFWDVTEQRRAEEELRKTSERLVVEGKFRELLEAAPDAVVVVNREENIVVINTQAEKVFGYQRDKMLGMAMEALIPKRFRGNHHAYDEGYAADPEFRAMGTGLELYALRRDGTEFPVEISLSPLQTAEGALVSCTIRDITERKRAERSREQLASIVDYSDDAIIGKSLDGTIINWNRGAERLYGYSAQEIIGRSISILLPDDYADELKLIVAKLRRGEAVTEETLRRRKDGALIDVALTVSPIRNSRGEVTGASAIARDISERKRVEGQIRNLNRQLEQAAAQAEAANRAKSTFLSTMSHEIRTPMNAILGYAQLMARDSSLSAEAKTNLKTIGHSGEHLLALISDILDMSKIEAGRAELNPASFNLAKMLEDLAAMFRLRGEAKALHFELTTDIRIAPYIRADEGKLRQTLINLLGNAIKFTQQGFIRIHAALERRDASRLWLTIQIQDSGPGISAEDQERLFVPFTQARRGLNTEGGTGLGLAISRAFASLMGGKLSLTSAPGQGSTFQLEIPVEGVDTGDGSMLRNGGRRIIGIRTIGRPPKILVADDQFANRDWLMKLLTVIGFEVRTAVDGQDALRVWDEWKPALILMDIHMPVMDGLEATRRVKSAPRGQETTIIALTASAMDGDRQSALQCGADDFLPKPCSEDELLDKIATPLEVIYQYEEPVNPAGPDGALATAGLTLKPLPAELVRALQDAVLTGNKRLLDRLIGEVRERVGGDPANRLAALAGRYEYDALTKLLEEACL